MAFHNFVELLNHSYNTVKLVVIFRPFPIFSSLSQRETIQVAYKMFQHSKPASFYFQSNLWDGKCKPCEEGQCLVFLYITFKKIFF